MSVLAEYLSTLQNFPVVDSRGIAKPSVSGSSESRLRELAVAPRTAPRTVEALAAALDSGELTSHALVSAVLDEAADRDIDESGWAWLQQEARDEALASDERRGRGAILGPLDGIPIGVKDLFQVAAQPTGCGSRHGDASPANFDASSIARLRAAGAVVVGKTTTHEFAFGGTTPPTRNPWSRERIPGGSSGGSGAVVGAGTVPVAIGSDTAGSVRIPASYCGTVGFIGSPGVVPTDGVATLAWSLDTVGPLTRSVRDAAFVQDVMAGAESPSFDVPAMLPVRVGLPEGVLEPLDPGVAREFRSSLASWVDRGVEIVEVPWPDEDALQAVGFVVMMAEAAEYHRARMDRRELFDPEVAELLSLGARISAQDYLRALRVRSMIAAAASAVFEQVTIVATPTLPCPPAPYGSGTFTQLTVGPSSMTLAAAHTRYPLLANVAGLPAGSVPCGLASGLPVGLQVMGAPGSDRAVLSAMAGLEAILKEDGIWEAGAIAPVGQ